MGLSPDQKLVVKHTFLEYVDDENTLPPQHHKPSRQRSFTEPHVVQTPFYDELREHFHTNESASSSTSNPDTPQTKMPTAPIFEMESFATPEMTPLAYPALGQGPAWGLSMLPEAYCCQSEDYYPWFEQYSADEWWCPGVYGGDAAVFSAGGDEQFLEACEQHRAIDRDSVLQGTVGSAAVVAPTKKSMRYPLGVADVNEEKRTSVMLRDLPETYTRASLVKLLYTHGFFGRFDFMYLPMDFKRQKSLGYALINLVSPSEALRFTKQFDGFSSWDAPSSKVCSVAWCSPQQGLQAHVERYRNSPVMHESVPEEWRPLMLSHGVPIPFPPPTQKIKAPKVKGMKEDVNGMNS